MSSFFRKFLKRTAPNLNKLTPKFVKKSRTLSALANADIMHRAIKQNYMIANAKSWSDTKAMRENLRVLHEEQTSPFSKTSKMIWTRDHTNDPKLKAQLTDKINAATLKRGHIGIAVGTLAVGGVYGAALKAGGKVLVAKDAQDAAKGVARRNRSIQEGAGGVYAQAETLPDGYDTYTSTTLHGPQGHRSHGIVEALVDTLFSIFVPQHRHIDNQSKPSQSMTSSWQSFAPPANNPTSLNVVGSSGMMQPMDESGKVIY